MGWDGMCWYLCEWAPPLKYIELPARPIPFHPTAACVWMHHYVAVGWFLLLFFVNYLLLIFVFDDDVHLVIFLQSKIWLRSIQQFQLLFSRQSIRFCSAVLISKYTSLVAHRGQVWYLPLPCTSYDFVWLQWCGAVRLDTGRSAGVPVSAVSSRLWPMSYVLDRRRASHEGHARLLYESQPSTHGDLWHERDIRYISLWYRA